MKISKEDAVYLLNDLGFADVDQWNDVKVTEYLNGMKKYHDPNDPDSCPKTARGREVLEKVLESLAGEKEVFLAGTAPGTHDPAKKKKGAKAMASAAKNNGKTNPNEKGKTPGKAPAGKNKVAKPDRDSWNCRVGTDRNKINMVLSKKPQTMNEIVTAAGTALPHYGYMRYLVQKGLVTRDEENRFALVGDKAKAPKVAVKA